MEIKEKYGILPVPVRQNQGIKVSNDHLYLRKTCKYKENKDVENKTSNSLVIMLAVSSG